MDKIWKFKSDQFLHEQITLQYPDIDVSKILDHEMSFYEAERGSVFGLKQEFISASRLDNLLSCFVGLEALLSVESEESLLLVCNDHEEVGSQSAVGADGAMLEQFLKQQHE